MGTAAANPLQGAEEFLAWEYLVVTGLSSTVTLEPGTALTPLAEIYETSSVIDLGPGGVT